MKIPERAIQGQISGNWFSIIPLSNGGYTIVDLLDREKVDGFHWHRSKNGYARTYTRRNGKRQGIYMHRLIGDPPKGSIVDHINQNKLDNRRNNLRICGKSENAVNSRLRRDNTSGYRGIFFERRRWRAGIHFKGHFVVIGRYDTREEAALAYNIAAIGVYGEFASLNEVPGVSNVELYQLNA